jgi:hypothetical protein
MSIGRKVKVLDGEEIFKYYYIEMGNARSYPKLVEWITSKYGLNPETGKKFTISSIWQAAWKWAFKNLDEARKIYSEVYLSQGSFLSDAEWWETVSRHAKTILSRPQYKKLIAKYPQLRPYEFMKK